MPITLRPATIDDDPFLYELYASTRAEELAAWGWNDDQMRMFLDLQFRAQQLHYSQLPNADHQIVARRGQPIGRLLVARLTTEIRLADISLIPEQRGRGLGASLIKSLLDEGRRSGKAVRLHVERFNRAQNLYHRLGFRVIKDTGSHFLMEWRTPEEEN